MEMGVFTAGGKSMAQSGPMGGRSPGWVAGLILFAMVLVSFQGCGPKPPVPVTQFNSLELLAPEDYPDFADTLGDEGLEHALRASLVYFNRIPDSRSFQFGPDVFDAVRLRQSVQRFLEFVDTGPDTDALDRFIRDNYRVYGSRANTENGVLFTGYYEPSMAASLVRDDEYQYPLFSVPDDLLTIDLAAFSDRFKGFSRLTARVDNHRVVPYYTRQEINGIKDFELRARPLAWVRDRTDRFFLEIQGSGRLFLKQGGEMNVHYSTKNGHPYRAVGRYLIDQGEIARADMSMQAIRRWIENNPSRQDELFNYNPSFVFFQKEQGGPFGSINVELTPLRSIATDRTLFPKGALCFVETKIPDPDTLERPEAWQPFSGFVMNQDTGGAIQGPGRCDLFYGNGRYAEFGAGHMKHPGNLYFLVLRP